MLGHLGVNVPDLGRAAEYYGQLYEPFPTAEDAIAFMPADGKRGAYLFLYEATDDRGFTREATGLQHLAFVVPTRPALHAVHTSVIGVGGTVLHPPILARSLRHHARGRLPPRSRLITPGQSRRTGR